MAENVRPPVAVRIVRPYDTEEAFLESELETVGKTSVILIGAHSRPTGVILRFEVTLTNGATVLRGEGRVLAHKESAFRGQPGLALRFTRLDPKSKAVVDRAAAIREQRLSGGDSLRPAPVSVPPPTPSPEPRRPAPSARPAPVSARPGLLSNRPPPVSQRPSPNSERPPVSNRPPSPSSSNRPPVSNRPPGPGSVRPSGSARPASLVPDPVLAEILTSPTPSPSPVDAGRLGTTPPSVPEPPISQNSSITSEIAIEPLSAPRMDVSIESVPPAAVEKSAEPVARVTTSAAAEGRTGTARTLSPPANRDDLLMRLRARAAGLTAEKRDAVLRTR